MTSAKLRSAILVAAPLLAIPAPPAEVAYSPEEGLEITKTIETRLELELQGEEVSVSVDGEQHPAPEPPEVEITHVQEERLVVVEEFRSVSEERPLVLAWTFEEIFSQTSQDVVLPDGETDNIENEAESELEGTTIVFTWDEDAEEFDIAFDDDEGDEDLLADLEANGDLSWFLPGDDVDEGDTWDVDVDAFNRLTSPGGDLQLDREEQEGDEEIDEELEENMQGGFTCEFLGERDEDGVRVAAIAITGEAESSADAELDPQDIAEGEATMTVTREIGVEFEFEGELLWNLDAGVFYAYELNGDVEYLQIEKREIEGPNSVVIVSTRTFDGTFVMTGSAE